MKICCTCKTELCESNFHKNRTRKDGLSETCKECAKKRSRDWWQKNKERAHARAHEYLAKSENAEANRRRSNNWYWANREHALESGRTRRASNIDAIHRYDAERTRTDWRRKQKARYKENRRAKIAGVLSTLTQEQWIAILDLFEHRCAYCGAGGVTLEKDHVVPVSRGGNHSEDNVVPACRHCNAVKHTKTPEEMHN